MARPYLSRVEFSEEDDLRIVQFLAKYTPDGRDRSGNAIWLSLRNNPRKWPWCERHSWQSWRNRYCKNRDRFDVLVRKWLKRYDVEPGILPPTTSDVRTRIQFSAQDDNFLEQYLAKYSISSQGRLGNKLYTTLVANEKQKWPWAKRHPASAWRERYKNNREHFDELIADRQKDNPPVENLQTPARVPRKRVRRRVQEEEEEDEADGQEEQAPAEHPRTTEKVDEQGQAVNMVIQEDDEREEREESEQESGPSDKKGKGKEKRKRSNGSATAIAMEPERKRRRVEGPADDAHEEVTEPTPTPNDPVFRPQKEHEHAPGPLQRAKVLPANQQAAASAQATSWVGGGNRAERETQLTNPPPSDDYQGDIFAKRNEEDVEDVEDVEDEEEEVDQLDSASPSPKPDGGEQKMDVDVDMELPRSNVKDDGSEARQAHHLATPLPFGADVDQDLTPNGRLYPKVPSPPGPVGGDSSLPDGYPRPAMSTPVRQGHWLNFSVVSQVLPSLLWSQKAPAKTAQGPTPPTSHTETPLATPTAATKRVPVHTNGADKHAQSAIPDGNHEKSTDMPAETILPSASMAVQPNSEAGPSTAIAPASRIHMPRPSLIEHESEFFQSDTPSPSSKPNKENSPMRMKRRKAPVQLEQGAFNSAFTNNKGRRRLDGLGRRPRVSGVEADMEEEMEENDEGLVDDIEWPPRRRKDKGKGKQREAGTFGALSEAVKPETDARDVQPSASTSNAPATMHHPFSQFSQPEEASHVMQQFRPRQHHPFSQATQPVAGPSHIPPTSFIDEGEAISVSTLSRIQIAKDPRIQAIVRKSTHLLQSDTVNVGQGMSHDRLEPTPSTIGTVRTEEPVVRPVLVPFRLPELEKARTERRFSAGEAPKNSQADELRNIRPEQRQIVAKSNGKQPLIDGHHPGLVNRRHTMGPPVDVFEITAEEAIEVPHLDVRRISMKRDRRSMPSLLPERMLERNVDDFEVTNRSRQIRTRSSTNHLATNVPSNEPPDQLSDADESLMLSLAEKELRRLGMESAIQTMSDNHGFNPNVVRAVFDRTGSLRKTDNVLRRMREAADRVADIMIDDADSEEDASTSRRSRQRRPSFQGKEHEAPLRSSHMRNSSILQHERMDLDGNDEELETVCSPPKQSRAGQFARLVREGREEEAFFREASGILGTTPLQRPAGNGDGPSNWQERSRLTTSPTHKAYRGHFSRSGSPIFEERRHDHHLETPSQQSSANVQALTEALKQGKLGKLDELNEKVGSKGMQILFGAMFRRMLDDS
ncbi:uncharacterized protein LAESUDRAFT_746997 [Laetiporus sulphureus 93-53]|uniref:TERF2-interacting telomeric protein 1 Myb domain-containing protein n=1 Tax=Laetiporus sulphureus 93-53 TaxID=1314785 RepID=A0A165H3B6_9APHY|nr:uncharacterized protein LAESUDRAFT_746997 [Laetiporus sulphureus 93-53]KZT11186.1 hypothetical protein LAESUDRAFT_746997 [Laetiporus sulphureus 93-53]